MKYQSKIDVKVGGFQVNAKQRGTKEQQKGKECNSRTQEVEKLRIQNPQSGKSLWNWIGRFTKLLEVKVLYDDIGVCHMQIGIKNHELI